MIDLQNRKNKISKIQIFLPAVLVIAMSQSPGLPETLATACNPGMCLLALPVIVN